MTDVEQQPRPMWRRITGSTLFHLVLAFVVVGLVLSFVAKPYWVPSGSMEQTLKIDDRVLVNRLAYAGDAHPSTGEIIVFDADETWGEWGSNDEGPLKKAFRWIGEVSGFGPSGPHTLIKRVIAGPGQTVSCCTAEGALIVDGKPLDEPYIYQDLAFDPGTLDCTTTPISPRCLPEVTVPEDSYLVLGDHRSSSADSAYRCRGERDADPGCWLWARDEDVVGRATVILWPASRWSGL
ncbi:signal peptidase I [Microbacterium sp. H1-D42]|uniref:signal peptidase I n=1 Tax=Microbacterium sp. H1-D42 TaxID=2925844 RepID=UPI001F52C4AA|nr:signal peptidase I [Microbacterium sp. H1-D42]UNK70104.1 signal peptidase I [Microbacterium sp. H1-D42]